MIFGDQALKLKPDVPLEVHYVRLASSDELCYALRSPYLTILSTPLGQKTPTKITITTLRITSGKVVHSFTKKYTNFVYPDSMAIVP